jgi:hypothetical protein
MELDGIHQPLVCGDDIARNIWVEIIHLGCEADNSPYSVEVKKGWIYTSVFMV